MACRYSAQHSCGMARGTCSSRSLNAAVVLRPRSLYLHAHHAGSAPAGGQMATNLGCAIGLICVSGLCTFGHLSGLAWSDLAHDASDETACQDLSEPVVTQQAAAHEPLC